MKTTNLFTYYADKDKVLPTSINLRAQAKGQCDGEDLDANVVLTLSGSYFNHGLVEYDMEKLRYQLCTRRARPWMASRAAGLKVTGASPGGHDRHFCVAL